MKVFLKFLFVISVAAAIAAVVASIVSKKKIMSMSDDEIREFLSSKLSGRVGDEQLGKIQDAVVSKVRGKAHEVEHYIDEPDDAEPDDAETDDAETDADSDDADEIDAPDSDESNEDDTDK